MKFSKYLIWILSRLHDKKFITICFLSCDRQRVTLQYFHFVLHLNSITLNWTYRFNENPMNYSTYPNYHTRTIIKVEVDDFQGFLWLSYCSYMRVFSVFFQSDFSNVSIMFRADLIDTICMHALDLVCIAPLCKTYYEQQTERVWEKWKKVTAHFSQNNA